MKILLLPHMRAVPSAHGGAWLRLGRWRLCRWLHSLAFSLAGPVAGRPYDAWAFCNHKRVLCVMRACLRLFALHVLDVEAMLMALAWPFVDDAVQFCVIDLVTHVVAVLLCQGRPKLESVWWWLGRFK